MTHQRTRVDANKLLFIAPKEICHYDWALLAKRMSAYTYVHVDSHVLTVVVLWRRRGKHGWHRRFVILWWRCGVGMYRIVVRFDGGIWRLVVGLWNWPISCGCCRLIGCRWCSKKWQPVTSCVYSICTHENSLNKDWEVWAKCGVAMVFT